MDGVVIPRPCLTCRKPTRNPGGRCEQHQREYLAQRYRERGSRQERGYDAAYERARAQCIRDQPWCSVPECMHPGSIDNPLTADHVISLADGGSSELSNLRTMCRFHNSQRGAG